MAGDSILKGSWCNFFIYCYCCTYIMQDIEIGLTVRVSLTLSRFCNHFVTVATYFLIFKKDLNLNFWYRLPVLSHQHLDYLHNVQNIFNNCLTKFDKLIQLSYFMNLIFLFILTLNYKLKTLDRVVHMVFSVLNNIYFITCKFNYNYNF